MKQRHCLLVLVFVVLGSVACAAYVDGPTRPWPPAAHFEISLFWDALSPYGDWLWVDPWGWVWTPWDVGPGWRPYTDGHWVWTHLGWTWVSERPWGWAPFHYGRWTYHSPHGWLWIPDTVWAPAWVAWRSGHGWIGWAPLPPQARWRIGFGLDLGGIDLGLSIVEHGWSFCGERDFLDRRVDRRLASLPRHAYLLRETRDATRYEEIERRVAVRSFDVEEIERQVGTVPRYRIEDLERPPHGGEAVSGSAVRIYRPEVKDESPGREPERRVAPPPEAKGTRPQEPPPAVREKEKKEIERRQAQELRTLRSWEEEQRQKLEKEQQRERRQPPAQEKPAALERRQEEERRALRKDVEREKQVLDNRVERKAKAQQEVKEKQQEKQRQAKPKPPA